MAGHSQHPTTWHGSPPALVERFEAATEPLLAEPGVERRKMFGYPACFVAGNLFTSLFGDRWIVRLADDHLAALAAAGGASFEPMPGRPMTGYLALPPELTELDVVGAWLEKALARGRSLPVKGPRPAGGARRSKA